MEATFHPDRYRYAGALSAFLTPSRTFENGAITAGMNEFGGVNTQAMWGAAQLGRWKWHDPTSTPSCWWTTTPGCGSGARRPSPAPTRRRWPATATRSPAAPVFYGHYRSLGGRNGHFDFPVGGEHDWGNWAGQLGAMSGDIAAAIR